MPTARVLYSPADEADRYLPEGPRAVTAFGKPALSWVNIQTGPQSRTGAVHLKFPGTGERRRWNLPARPGFAFPTDAPDTLFIGLEKAIGTLHLGTGKWTPFAGIPDDNPRTIINDGEILPGGGGLVFGTKDTQFKEPIARLYLFTLADNALTELAGRYTCSNGKLFAGDTLFDIDTPRKNVTRYRLDLARRELTEEGVALDLRGDDAYPDGMCDGGGGTAIIAFYDPRPGRDGVARQYHLGTGKVVQTWRVPGSPRVTCPTLIQHEGQARLILTTATEDMPAADRVRCPNAGSLFVAEASQFVPSEVLHI